MRLLCRLLGGHHWSDWAVLVFHGWVTNGEPHMRYCTRCLALDYDAMGRLMTRVVAEESA